MYIIGISEARWVESGMAKERSGKTVIYSGREDNQHTEDVAIIMSDKAAKAFLEWKPLGRDSSWLDLTLSTPSSLSSPATHP